MKTSRNTRRGLPLDWTKHLPESERKDFEAAVRHDTYVLGRLLEIVDEKLKALDHEEVSPSAYDNPSWAYKQAHMNGQRQGLITVKNLLSFLDQ